MHRVYVYTCKHKYIFSISTCELNSSSGLLFRIWVGGGFSYQMKNDILLSISDMIETDRMPFGNYPFVSGSHIWTTANGKYPMYFDFYRLITEQRALKTYIETILKIILQRRMSDYGSAIVLQGTHTKVFCNAIVLYLCVKWSC